MTEFKIKPQDFIDLSPVERLQAVWEALPASCDGDEYPNHQSTCREALIPVADFLNPLPPKVQTPVLFGLSKWIRLELFEKMGQSQSPEELAELILNIPSSQTPFLIARIPPEKRIKVINELKARGADSLIHFWCERYRKDVRVRRAAQRMEKTADAMGLSNEALLALVQIHPFNNAIYATEVIRRVGETNKKGNGVELPAEKIGYADLSVENYSDSGHWTVRGFFMEEGRWRPFLFSAKKPAYLEELWVAGKLFFPSESQKQLFAQKIFSWARTETLARRGPLETPDSFLEITKLSLQRIDHFFEKRKAPQFSRTFSSRSVYEIMNPKTKTVTAQKPTTEFYFEEGENRTLVVTMDEATHQLTYTHFTQLKEEAKKVPIDDGLARGLLPLVQSLPNQNPHVRKLVQKLVAISEYR